MQSQNSLVMIIIYKLYQKYRNYFYELLSLTLLLFVFASCNQVSKPEKNDAEVKYVFYFIADGLGYSHISLTEAYLANLNNEIGAVSLTMTDFPVHGMVNTFSKNRQTTGSAAAGTAMAYGRKEDINKIAYFDGDFKESKSILQLAADYGYANGLISTVSLNHATPAAFYANAPSRKKYYEIALQLSSSTIDYLGGGGLYKNTGDDLMQLDVYNILLQNGYNIVSQKSDVDYNSGKLYFKSHKLFSEAEMPYAIDNKDKYYMLKDFLQVGIDFLKGKEKFFIVIEGGKIDWASHENDAATIVNEIIDFDMAVKSAYEFYLKYPDETLIIVSSDHETGGLALGINKNSYETDFAALNLQKISQFELSNKVSVMRRKNKTWSEILKMIKLEFFDSSIQLNEEEQSMLELAYLHSITPSLIGSFNYRELYGTYCPISFTATRIINNRASVGFTTTYHTAAAVPIFSIGNNSQLFLGSMDNTEIPIKIQKVIKP